MDIRREFRKLTVTVETVATGTVIPFAGVTSARIYVPATSSITSLTFYDAPDAEGTMLPSYDADNVAVTMTVAAGRSYPVPAVLQGAGAIALVGNVAGSVDVLIKG